MAQNGYVDFEDLKKRTTIEDVAQLLGLQLKKAGDQLRGPCPIHPNGDRAFVITPSKGLFYCFEPKCLKGGDLIELVAKVKRCSVKEAAQFLDQHYGEKERDEPTEVLNPLEYLDPAHAAVLTLGFPEEVAKALGAGFAGKGIMRGRVAVPLRTPEGKLVGYMGISPALDPAFKLPSKWHL